MPERKPDYQRAQIEAEQLIKKNYVSSPPVSIQDLAEGEGLSVALAKFDEGEISGFIDLEKKTILVNHLDSLYRQRFTIAHELGHWILHRKEVEQNENITILYRKIIEENESDPLEQEANCFAANILVPLFLLEGVSKPSFSNKALANTFMVSEAVMGFRRKLLTL